MPGNERTTAPEMSTTPNQGQPLVASPLSGTFSFMTLERAGTKRVSCFWTSESVKTSFRMDRQAGQVG